MRGALLKSLSDKTTALGCKRSFRALADSMNSKPARETKKKGKGAGSNEIPPTCLEVQTPAMDVQDFFQSFVREQLGESAKKMSPRTAWSFYRYVDKDNSCAFRKKAHSPPRELEAGEGAYPLRTRELEKGSRGRGYARFRGYGQSVDRFAPPKDSGCWNPTARSRKTLISLWSRTSILSISAGLLNPRRRNGERAGQPPRAANDGKRCSPASRRTERRPATYAREPSPRWHGVADASSSSCTFSLT